MTKLADLVTEGVELLELGGSNPRPATWHYKHAQTNKQRAARYYRKQFQAMDEPIQGTKTAKAIRHYGTRLAQAQKLQYKHLDKAKKRSI